MSYKLTFLLDPKNLWIEKYLKNYDFRINKKFKYKFSKNYLNVKNQDIVIILSYTKILGKSFLKKNKLNIIVHPSKLPKNKGFAPVAYEVLKNKNKIYISLLKASNKVDSGPVAFQDHFYLDGTELSDEIRKKQAINTIKIVKRFLKKYPKVKFKDQVGKSNFNKKRTPKDSEINISKSIKSQFNLLRICNNDIYPCFFKYKGNTYLLKINKKNS